MGTEPARKNDAEKGHADFRSVLMMLTQQSSLLQAGGGLPGAPMENGASHLKDILQNISEKIKSLQNRDLTNKKSVEQNPQNKQKNIEPSVRQNSQKTNNAAQDAARESKPVAPKSDSDRNAVKPDPSPDSSAANDSPAPASTENPQTSAAIGPEVQREIDKALEDLHLDPQTKAIMNLLLMEAGSGSNDLLKALTGEQNLLGLNADGDSTNPQFLSALRDNETAVEDLLTKAGMTGADAKNLIAKIESGQENKLQVQDMPKENARADSADANAAFQAKDVSPQDGKNASSQNSGSGSQNKTDLSAQLGTKPKSGDAGPAFEFKITEQQANAASRLDAIDPKSPSGKTLDPLAGAQNAGDGIEIQNIAAASLNGPDSANAKDAGAAKGPATGGTPGVEAAGGASSKSAGAAEARSLPQQAAASRGMAEKPVVQQIMEKFSFRGTGQQNEIHIKLDPPSLGTVRMNISTVGETVKTTLIAENHSVKQIIENNLNQLRDSLADQGLKVDSFTVLVGGNPGNKGQNAQQGQAPFPGGHSQETAHRQETETGPPAPRERIFNRDSQSISVFA
ncbi:MAG: flagellar hook-length control protein FliK [Nitrospinae bacterium]|nr:flagellar hook-length control protein FliK [Nitrospinota bacterium]